MSLAADGGGGLRTLARHRITPSEPPAERHPTLILAIVLVAQIMIVLDATIVNVALPHIQAGLHFSAANLSWVLNAYTLTFGGLLLLGARAGDLLGRRRVFLVGVAIFVLASLAGGLSTSAGMRLVARAAQGLGGALAAPSALAVLTATFGEGEGRTRALGLYTAVSVGGSAVGLIVGGMLTAWVSWRWVLFVNVPIGIALLIVGRAFLPETARREGRFDLAGALLSTIGMTAVAYGFVHAATAGWRDAQTWAAMLGGVGVLAMFAAVERRASAPITPLRLFADRARLSSYVGRMFLVAGMFGMFFFLTQFLQDVLGYGPLRTGIAFLPLTVVLFAGTQLAARILVRRFGGYLLMMCGMPLSLLAELWLSRLAAGSGYADVLGPLLLFGIGTGLTFVPLTTASLTGVLPADAGAASGLVNVTQQIGGSVGLAALVTVAAAARNASTVADPRQLFAMGADRAFLVAAGFLAVTIVVIGVGLRPRGPAGSV